MRILFWNVQRLGAGTDDARRTILGQALYAIAPDVVLLCELTTASETPQAQNITYRDHNPAQLCYGAFDANGQTILLTRILPAAGAGYAGLYYGGNNFANLVDRALAYVGNLGGTQVYVFHAPAYQNGAARAMTFLAYALHEAFGITPWLVIGDFNVEPHNLPTFAQQFVVYGGATYIGGMPKAYDYVLTNRAIHNFQIHVPGGPGSDHLPISIVY